MCQLQFLHLRQFLFYRLICAKIVDNIGYRTCVVAAEVTSGLGLLGLGFMPEIMPTPFAGVIVSVIIYAIGSGLTEVLVSPIVEACPFENKEGTMSLLHSFYCWGSVGVILGSTIFFALFGISRFLPTAEDFRFFRLQSSAKLPRTE